MPDFPIEIEADKQGRHRVELSKNWSIVDSLTAGYLQTVATAAAMTTTRHPHPVAVSSQFLVQAQPGEAQAQVDVLRAGKTIDTVRVTLYQDDQAVSVSTVTASTLESRPADVDHCKQIHLPPPERCTRLEADSLRDRRLNVLEQVELRLAPECITVLHGSADGSFTLRGWLRMADGTDPDPLICLAVIDAFPPVSYTIGRYGWAPTVQMTSYVRDMPAPGWLRAEKRGRLLANGWIDDSCTMRDSAGKVVAQAHQLVRLPRPPKKAR